MRFKDRLSKDKQLTDRPQFTKHTDSTPSLARLEHDHQYHHAPPQHHAFPPRRISKDKENAHGMINSVPASQGDYLPHDAIKIDNYEGKRFKTQNNYEPTLVSSRYEGFGNGEKGRNAFRMRQSQEQFRMSEQYHWNTKSNHPKKHQNLELNKDSDRPLTFGLIKQTEPLRCSAQYRQDQKIKNQVLDEIHNMRKSQEALLGSKECSSNYVDDFFKCKNHQNKKAKYRLITEEIPDQESERQMMVYCSKCAINLLQQGFRVEELRKDQLIVGGMQERRKSKNFGQSRIQELKKLQEKLTEVEDKLQEKIQKNQDISEHIEQFSKQKKETQLLYDLLTDTLKQMKIFELRRIQEKKQNRINDIQKKKRRILEQFQTVSTMKQQIKEYRNKFIIMKDQEFQQTINSFLSKAQSFGFQQAIDHFPENQNINSKQKLNKIMQSLISNTEQRLGMDDNRYKRLQKKQSNEEFLCSERKKPFRTLFPEDDNQYDSNILQSPQTPRNHSRFVHIMEVSEENDSPSFQKMKKY